MAAAAAPTPAAPRTAPHSLSVLRVHPAKPDGSQGVVSPEKHPAGEQESGASGQRCPRARHLPAPALLQRVCCWERGLWGSQGLWGVPGGEGCPRGCRVPRGCGKSQGVWGSQGLWAVPRCARVPGGMGGFPGGVGGPRRCVGSLVGVWGPQGLPLSWQLADRRQLRGSGGSRDVTPVQVKQRQPRLSQEG